MDEPQPPERPIAEVRGIAADLRYGWDQAKATGDAEALARVHQLAKEAGAPREQLEQITDGFVAIAQELIEKQGAKRRRGSFRWGRSKRLGASEAQHIMPPEHRRELPLGEPE